MTTFDPNTGLTIVSSTDATPIVVECTPAHNLSNNDEVAIAAHLVNLAANGKYAITVVDATHFSLNGSVGSGSGAGGATGVIFPWTVAGIDVPADGNPRNAASVAAGLAAIADRSAFLRLLNVLKVVEFTTPGAFTDTVPDGACIAIVELWGGGGGGAGGAGSASGIGSAASGGGGGGGSHNVVRAIDVVPGTLMSGACAAGGAGGAAGAATANGVSGSQGDTSSYGSVSGAGGGGGCAGIINASAATATLSPGGNCLSSSGAAFVFATGGFIPQAQFVLLFCRGISEGGYSANDTAAGVGRNSAGNRSPFFAGGAAGGNGGADTGRLGGSGGGGGGGGPGGVGGAGGDGHFGVNGNSTCAGTAGSSPAANTGAGGGAGGGGGASNNGTGSVGGAGAAGGSGKVRVTYLGGVK